MFDRVGITIVSIFFEMGYLTGVDKHLLFALLIPVGFVALAGLVKCLIRKELSWSAFYLGIDLALGALANGLVNVLDDAHELDQIEPATVAKTVVAAMDNHKLASIEGKILYTVVFLGISIGALFLLMVIHQKWEDAPPLPGRNRRIARGIWLGIVSNVIGVATMFAFIVFKLGGVI